VVAHWVKPEDGMKKLVWAEKLVEGGKTISIKLPSIPSTTGPIQNLPIANSLGENDARKPIPIYSKNIAVIAYKLHENDIPMSVLQPTITSSAGKFTIEQLSDGDIATS
jgi:hypothetical protein